MLSFWAVILKDWEEEEAKEETDHATREGERKPSDIPEASKELFSRAEGDQLCQMLPIEHLMQLSVISILTWPFQTSLPEQ